MDMAPDSTHARHCPSNRVARRQRHRGPRSRLDRAPSSPVHLPLVTGLRDRPEHLPAPRVGSVTVEELSQIPGAREALANYIGILQEWSSRPEEAGAAP